MRERSSHSTLSAAARADQAEWTCPLRLPASEASIGNRGKAHWTSDCSSFRLTWLSAGSEGTAISSRHRVVCPAAALARFVVPKIPKYGKQPRQSAFLGHRERLARR